MIFEILNTLASDNGRNFKIDYLKQHKDNELLKRVVRLALDPYTQFFIRKIPDYFPNPDYTSPLDLVLDQLEHLSNRNVTGNAAIEHLTACLQSVHHTDAQVIERIISKDLKCGVSDSTANKVWPGLIPTYPCMLCSPFEQKLVDKIGLPAFVQLKMDGMRFNAIVVDGECEFRSRNGKLIDIPSEFFPIPFIKMAEHYKDDIVFDGELLVVDVAGKPLDRKTGNGILNKAVKGTMSEEEADHVRAVLWDAIPYDVFVAGKTDEDYHVRFAKLYNSMMDMTHRALHTAHLVAMVESHKVHEQHEIQRLFNKALESGQEGIILKSFDGGWEDKRVKHQIKFKGEFECDLICTDWEIGTGKNKDRLGALQLRSSCGKLEVGVGSGFNDEHRDTIGRDVIGKVIAVKFNAVVDDKRTGMKSLFLPIFLEVREDKNTADDLQTIMKIAGQA